jgi:serine/threonine-protein kinase
VRGLGTGSFGSVYVGHRRGNPYVAIKVLHVEFTESPDVVMKFLKEAYATAGLEHKNIVRFGDSGHEAGHWFIILEYFPSRSLRDILEERQFLPAAEALPIAKQFLEALEYAHERKLLHRDVKPGNILVNETGEVKMVDFGLAKRLVDSAFTQQTATGMPGTPLFMAPELMNQTGARATFKADIYSAAATIYRTLTGRHPIEAKKLDEWFEAIQTAVPPPASSVRPEIPERVSKALAKALSKDPAARQGSMAELRRDLGI